MIWFILICIFCVNLQQKKKAPSSLGCMVGAGLRAPPGCSDPLSLGRGRAGRPQECHFSQDGRSSVPRKNGGQPGVLDVQKEAALEQTLQWHCWGNQQGLVPKLAETLVLWQSSALCRTLLAADTWAPSQPRQHFRLLPWARRAPGIWNFPLCLQSRHKGVDLI